VNVLITGASSGIGRACAAHLQGLGHRVFAGIRRGEVPAGQIPVVLDVTDPGQVSGAAEQIANILGDESLDGLVNNAGIGGGGPVEFTPVDDFRKVMEVNFFGQIAVTQAVLPLIRKGPGRIANVASVGGRFAGPLMATYHASKWALEAASDCLREELQPDGIHVSVIEPGTVKTGIWTKAEDQAAELKGRLPPEAWKRYGERIEAFTKTFAQNAQNGVEPSAVAKAVEHALTASRPRTRYIVGSDARAVLLAKWMLPDRTFDWLLRSAR